MFSPLTFIFDLDAPKFNTPSPILIPRMAHRIQHKFVLDDLSCVAYTHASACLLLT